MSLKTIALRVEPPGMEPFEHTVAGEELVVGRSSRSGLVIPDPYLSRRQARVFRSDGRWYVEHLGKRNATLLIGVAISGPMELLAGDVVKMSETVVRVSPGDQPPAGDDGDTPAPGSLFRPVAAVIERAQQLEADPALRHRTSRLRLLNDVHRLLARPMSVGEVLQLVLERVFAELVPEEGVVLLNDGHGGLHRAATRRQPGVSGEFFHSRHLAREVTEKQLAALVFDTSRDLRFSTSQSIVSAGVRSLVAAPLVDSKGCHGMIVLSSRAHVRRFSEEDLELLVSLASVAAMHLRNIELTERAARQQALEKELALARAIQVALIPEKLPQPDGYELAGFNAASRAVSGDLYKAEMRRDGRDCVLMLADVSGKGISAALLTASLEALSAGPIEVGLEPDDICGKLSRRLHARTSAERYATAFLGVLDSDRHLLRYANAGHNPALLLGAGGETRQLGATGVPLGLLPTAEYAMDEVALAPGDVVVIYTDGVTEATNPEAEEYGTRRLEAMVRKAGAASAAEIIARVDEDLDAFVAGVPFADDRTLMVLRRR